jgi:hypothetical protein
MGAPRDPGPEDPPLTLIGLICRLYEALAGKDLVDAGVLTGGAEEEGELVRLIG